MRTSKLGVQVGLVEPLGEVVVELEAGVGAGVGKVLDFAVPGEVGVGHAVGVVGVHRLLQSRGLQRGALALELLVDRGQVRLGLEVRVEEEAALHLVVDCQIVHASKVSATKLFQI